jgi:hypothetical protein
MTIVAGIWPATSPSWWPATDPAREGAHVVTLFISRYPDVVVFQARAEGDDDLIGDFRSEVHPGETAFGLTFDEWMALDASSITVTSINPPAFTIDAH